MAIQTVYYRQKIEGTGWRYRPRTVGRRPEAAKNGPYFIRVRDSAGKYQWVKHETEQAAEKAAKAAPVARQAQELGLTVDDLTNEANTNRISIKTAIENYLQDRRFGRPRSIAAYENAFDQLLANLPRGVRFIDQLATSRVLNSYVEFLREQDYSNKTFPSGVLDFLLAAPSADKKEIPQIFLGRHRREEFGQFVRVVRLRPGPLNLRKLDDLRRLFNTVRLKQRKNKTHSNCDGFVAVALLA